MLGGTEVSAGKIVEYGANHTKLSQSLSITLGDGETIEDYLVAEAELEGLPETLQGTTATYASTQNYDVVQTTYFTIDDDGNNQILGYSNLMSMGVEEDHLEEGDGGSGLEDWNTESMKHRALWMIFRELSLVPRLWSQVLVLKQTNYKRFWRVQNLILLEWLKRRRQMLMLLSWQKLPVSKQMQLMRSKPQLVMKQHYLNTKQIQPARLLDVRSEALDAASEEGDGEEGDGRGDGDEGTPSFFRVDYNDADWNYLGSSYSDEFGSGYNFNEVIDGIRYEKGSENRYKVDNENNVIVDEDSGEQSS